MAHCKQCGAELPYDASFCNYCGYSMKTDTIPIEPEKPISGLMALDLNATKTFGAQESAAVITAGAYWGYIFLMSIPVVGWAVCLVWAFGRSNNLNRRNLARAMLVFILLQILFAFAIFQLLRMAVGFVAGSIQQAISQLPADFLADFGLAGKSLQQLLDFLESLPF